MAGLGRDQPGPVGVFMTAHELLSQVLPSLLAGTSRRPLTTSMTKLQALSLTGQALRLSGPSRPTDYSLEPEVGDRRKVVPEDCRRALVRLLAGKKAQSPESDPLALALALTLERQRLRLHPFDLPRLEAFVRVYSARLGTQAQVWAQRGATAEDQRGFFEADDLTDATWHMAGYPAKARYIEERRRQDASAARNLVQQVWASENADGRVRLLKAIQVGLGNDDVPFLESLAKDRAPRVRDLALRLLSRLGRSGSSGLEACLERIERSQVGMLRKRPVLALRPPATVNDQGLATWVVETFGEIGLDDLARGLGLSAFELIEAAQKDEPLLFASLVMATAEGRLDLVKAVMAQGLSQAWEVLQSLPFDLSLWSVDNRVRWADAVVQPSSWGPSSLWSLTALFKRLESPISEGLFDAVLSSKAWSEFSRDKGKVSSETLELLAAVCPSGRRPRLRTLLDNFPGSLTTRATSFLEILTALEAHA